MVSVGSLDSRNENPFTNGERIMRPWRKVEVKSRLTFEFQVGRLSPRLSSYSMMQRDWTDLDTFR